MARGPRSRSRRERSIRGGDIPFSVIDLAKRPDIDVPDSDRHPMRTFLVRFDEPAHDTSEDAPITWLKSGRSTCVQPISELRQSFR